MSTENHPNQTITTQIGREAIIQKDCRNNKNIPILGEGGCGRSSAVAVTLSLWDHLKGPTPQPTN